jgi:hypothetical protein
MSPKTPVILIHFFGIVATAGNLSGGLDSVKRACPRHVRNYGFFLDPIEISR